MREVNYNNLYFGLFLIVGCMFIIQSNWKKEYKSISGKYGRIKRLSTGFIFLPLGLFMVLYEIFKMWL